MAILSFFKKKKVFNKQFNRGDKVVCIQSAPVNVPGVGLIETLAVKGAKYTVSVEVDRNGEGYIYFEEGGGNASKYFKLVN